MDAATAASVAALAVSIMAMTVAFAQALQQYLITGQLIRMCDSVVYGKMPGQGRRIWEWAQFRFRVVYSVPQLYLRPGLWLNDYLQDWYDAKDYLSVPDLRHTSEAKKHGLRDKADVALSQQSRSPYSAQAGEASWVSFSRMAQYASGNDFFYELVDDDADRCPADLRTVPMQVSMRDVVAIALMAGLRCTSASFEAKSLAMEGSAGTITTSSHPLLGSVIHFAPRIKRQFPGLRIGSGNILPSWMARLRDAVVVAGRPFSLRERIHYEAYEGSDWIPLSGDQMVARLTRTGSRFRSTSSNATIRRRKQSRSSMPSFSVRAESSGSVRPSSLNVEADNGAFLTPSEEEASFPASHHDGEWTFESEAQNSKVAPPNIRKSNDELSTKDDWTWVQRLKAKLRRHSRHKQTSSDELGPRSFEVDIESLTVEEASEHYSNRARNTVFSGVNIAQQTPRNGSGEHPRLQPAMLRKPLRQHLDGARLQEYIKEKRRLGSAPNRTPLLLTWPVPREGEPQTDPESAIEDDDLDQFGDWRDAYHDMEHERKLSHLEQWRDVLYRRQQNREGYARDDELEITEVASNELRSRRPSSAARSQAARNSLTGRRPSRRSRQRSRRATDDDYELIDATERGRARHRAAWSRNAQSLGHRDVGSFTTQGRRHFSSSGIRPLDVLPITYGHSPVPNPQSSIDSKKSEKEGLKIDEDNTERPHRNVGFLLKNGSASQSPNVQQEEHTDITDTNGIGADSTKAISKETVVPTQNQRNSESSDYFGDYQAIASPQDLPQKETILDQADGVIRQDKGSSRVQTPNEITLPTRKGVLKSPRPHFPEDLDIPVREGVAPRSIPNRSDIPADARWTKIDSRLVSTEALEFGNERYVVASNHVIVLRVLTRGEIERYAERTTELREMHELTQRSRARRARNFQLSMSPESPTPNSSTDHLDGRPAKRSPSPKPSDLVALPDTPWSNESIFGWGNESHLSESPPRMPSLEFEEPHSPFTRRRNNRDSVFSRPPRDSATAYSPHRRRSSPLSQRQTRPSYPAGHGHSRTSVSPRRRKEPAARSSSNAKRWKSLEWAENPEYDEIVSVETNSDSSANSDASSYVIWDSEVADGRNTRDRGSVDWFWVCQADVVPGYLATPWSQSFSENACLSTIETLLDVLQHFTNRTTLQYVERQPQYEQWLRDGRGTHPPYAINAMGGIIVSGKYQRCRFDVFETEIPPIEILYNVDNQGNACQGLNNGSRAIIESLGELVGLDTWLSFCGRLPEICNGRSGLLRRMPSLALKMMTGFEYEFRNLDRTAAEGGYQIIQELGQLVVRELERQELSDAEQLFAAVAMLRTAKMALYIVQGPSTAKLREILDQDVQVYLV